MRKDSIKLSVAVIFLLTCALLRDERVRDELRSFLSLGNSHAGEFFRDARSTAGEVLGRMTKPFAT